MEWWTLIKGAAKYATGKRTSPMAAQDRARKCSVCPLMQVHAVDGLVGPVREVMSVKLGFAAYTGWCGNPGEKTDSTCGCVVLAEPEVSDGLVRLTIGNQDIHLNPAGKSTLESEQCPSLRW